MYIRVLNQEFPIDFISEQINFYNGYEKNSSIALMIVFKNSSLFQFLMEKIANKEITGSEDFEILLDVDEQGEYNYINYYDKYEIVTVSKDVGEDDTSYSLQLKLRED